MKTLIALCALAAALTLTGCGGSNKSARGIGQSYVDELSHIADALESVRDEDSAKLAARRIAMANVTLENLVNEINSMTKVEQVALVQRHAVKMAEAQARISKAMQNIVSNNPQLLDIIGQEMQNTPQLE